MKINVQHFAVDRVVLDFLHEREALGAGIVSTDKSTSRFSEAGS